MSMATGSSRPTECTICGRRDARTRAGGVVARERGRRAARGWPGGPNRRRADCKAGAVDSRPTWGYSWQMRDATNVPYEWPTTQARRYPRRRSSSATAAQGAEEGKGRGARGEREEVTCTRVTRNGGRHHSVHSVHGVRGAPAWATLSTGCASHTKRSATWGICVKEEGREKSGRRGSELSAHEPQLTHEPHPASTAAPQPPGRTSTTTTGELGHAWREGGRVEGDGAHQTPVRDSRAGRGQQHRALHSTALCHCSLPPNHRAASPSAAAAQTRGMAALQSPLRAGTLEA